MKSDTSGVAKRIRMRHAARPEGHHWPLPTISRIPIALPHQLRFPNGAQFLNSAPQQTFLTFATEQTFFVLGSKVHTERVRGVRRSPEERMPASRLLTS